jgi:OFA family oxalate/formate antiporter-like MFS transporter
MLSLFYRGLQPPDAHAAAGAIGSSPARLQPKRADANTTVFQNFFKGFLHIPRELILTCLPGWPQGRFDRTSRKDNKVDDLFHLFFMKSTTPEDYMTEPRIMNRWLAVVGAVLIQLSLGAIYAWSVFTPGLIAAGWSRLETQVVFSVGLAVFAVVMVWAGRRLPLWGPKRLAWLGGSILGLGYAMAGLLGATNFWIVTLFIGVLGGAGIGLAYVVPIAVGMRWFPDKKGLITGLAVAGFGFGALLWVKLAGSWAGLLANLGLSATFTIYGVIFAALVLLGGLWMVFPPAGWTPPGYVAPTPGPAGAKLGTGAVEFEAGRMLETPQFFLIFISFVVSAGAGLMSIGIMKLYPVEALTAGGMDKTLASEIAGTAMGVFFSIANGLGRIIWGSLSDKLGRKRSLQIMISSQGFFLMAFTFLAGHQYTLYLGAALIGFNFGGNFALFPTITADTFGTKHVGQNYPYVFLAYGVGGIAGPILGGQLGDLNNFPLAFTIVGIACILGAGCITMVSPPKRAEAEILVPEDAEATAQAVPALTHRILTDEDAALICHFPQNAKELFYMFPSAQPPLTAERLLAAAIQRTSPTVVLADDKVAGYANFAMCENGLCVVANVVVGPKYRRFGVGAYLMQVMEEKAKKEQQATRLRASVFSENTPALLFYNRLGFVPAGMETREDPDGNTVAVVHMEKTLA